MCSLLVKPLTSRSLSFSSCLPYSHRIHVNMSPLVSAGSRKHFLPAGTTLACLRLGAIPQLVPLIFHNSRRNIPLKPKLKQLTSGFSGSNSKSHIVSHSVWNNSAWTPGPAKEEGIHLLKGPCDFHRPGVLLNYMQSRWGMVCPSVLTGLFVLLCTSGKYSASVLFLMYFCTSSVDIRRICT